MKSGSFNVRFSFRDGQYKVDSIGGDQPFPDFFKVISYGVEMTLNEGPAKLEPTNTTHNQLGGKGIA